MSGAALDVNTASVNYCFVTNISCQTSDLKLPWLFISHDLENWLASPPADFAGLTQLCFLEGRWCWGIQAGLIHSQAVGSGQGSLVPLHVASYALIGKISSLKWQSQGRNGVRAETSRTLKVWTRTGTGIPCTDFYWSKQVSVQPGFRGRKCRHCFLKENGKVILWKSGEVGPALETTFLVLSDAQPCALFPPYSVSFPFLFGPCLLLGNWARWPGFMWHGLFFSWKVSAGLGNTSASCNLSFPSQPTWSWVFLWIWVTLVSALCTAGLGRHLQLWYHTLGWPSFTP